VALYLFDETMIMKQARFNTFQSALECIPDDLLVLLAPGVWQQVRQWLSLPVTGHRLP
jgi:hypothetical protein